MTADIAFYVDLACAADGPLAELAVGNGRVAIPVAREAGDRYRHLCGDARATPGPAAEAGIELDLYETDMRDLALGEPANSRAVG